MVILKTILFDLLLRITVKSRFYVIVGQQLMQRKIEIKRKIETHYLVNFEFGHQSLQRKFET